METVFAKGQQELRASQGTVVSCVTARCWPVPDRDLVRVREAR